jgi:hypothetical protein
MTEEQQIPSINLQDVAAMLQIIDAAAQRGAFKGDELTAVGTVRDKAAAFIEYVRKQAEEAQAATDEAAVDNTEE